MVAKYAVVPKTSTPNPLIDVEMLLVSTQYSFNNNLQIESFWTYVDGYFFYFVMCKACLKFVRTFQLHCPYINTMKENRAHTLFNVIHATTS